MLKVETFEWRMSPSHMHISKFTCILYFLFQSSYDVLSTGVMKIHGRRASRIASVFSSNTNSFDCFPMINECSPLTTKPVPYAVSFKASSTPKASSFNNRLCILNIHKLMVLMVYILYIQHYNFLHIELLLIYLIFEKITESIFKNWIHIIFCMIKKTEKRDESRLIMKFANPFKELYTSFIKNNFQERSTWALK